MTPQELKRSRKALGLTVTGFAHEIGYYERTVRRWEVGGLAVPKIVALIVRLWLASDVPDRHKPTPYDGRRDRHKDRMNALRG